MNYFAKLEAERLEAQARPFRFEDLEGKPEPEKWGPCYPKTASAAVEKWRRLARVRELTADEKRQHGADVGTWIRGLNNPAAKRWRVPESDLHYPKYFTCESLRGKIRAAFAAQAGADRRDWASGQAKSKSHGHYGLTIAQAYARAMAEKRARLELPKAA